MNKLEIFLDQLGTAIAVKYFKTKHDTSFVKNTNAPKNSLVLHFRPKAQGLRGCVNCKQLTIHPHKGQPHCMLIEEVWLGYDGEGNRWSDHMGGLNVDCTGMKCKEAIEYITGKIWEDFKELVR